MVGATVATAVAIQQSFAKLGKHLLPLIKTIGNGSYAQVLTAHGNFFLESAVHDF